MSDRFSFHFVDEFATARDLVIPRTMETLFEPLPTIFAGVENLPPKEATFERKKSIRKRKLIEPIDIEQEETKKARKPFNIVNRMSKAIDAPYLKRSFSLRDRNKVSLPPAKPLHYHTPQRSRISYLERNFLVASNWIETVAEPYSYYTKGEIKVQEAIYTLYRTEIEYLQDLEMVVHKLAAPMIKLDLVTREEFDTIFSNIDKLIPVHENLIVRLQQVKCIDGRFGDIAKPFLEWIPIMTEAYKRYCPNLVFAKELFEAKKQKQSFCDYLEKCREFELMRKIEFWTFLDSPRSRLMKYPLMLKEISKLSQPDDFVLDRCLNELEKLITVIDTNTGFAKCDLVKRTLQYLTESQRLQDIDISTTLHFTGEMRNRHNVKLTVFLFDKVLVMAREFLTKSGTVNQVYRQPILLSDLEFENLADTHGTFKRKSTHVFSKSIIRFSSKSKPLNSISLQCQSDYDKKAWLEAISSAM